MYHLDYNSCVVGLIPYSDVYSVTGTVMPNREEIVVM